MVVHHECENKQCIQIKHLALLTDEEHRRWHILKRPIQGQRTGPNTEEWRARLSTATKKLSDTEVAQIKMLLGFGMKGAHIAARYGVSQSTISNIKHGKHYEEVR